MFDGGKKLLQIQTELNAAVKETSNRHKLSRFFPKQQLQSLIPNQHNKKGSPLLRRTLLEVWANESLNGRRSAARSLDCTYRCHGIAACGVLQRNTVAFLIADNIHH